MTKLVPEVEAERRRIREAFDAGASARETLGALCALADGAIRQVFAELQSVRNTETQGLSLMALSCSSPIPTWTS